MVLLEELEHSTLVQQFGPAHLKQLASMGQVQEYQTNDIIFSEGQDEHHLYLVLDGEVALEINVPDLGTLQVHKVVPGKLLGWSPVLDAGPMKATARALGPVRLAAFDAGEIRRSAEKHPRFGMEFFRCMSAALAERLRATRLQLPDVRRHQMIDMREGAD